MGDRENDLPASKKRVAGRQISKENPELDDDGPEPEMGTFKKASNEVLATRRIVKVRRTQTSAASSNEPNPFAALTMVRPAASSTSANNPPAQTGKPGDNTAMKDGAVAKHENSAGGEGAEIGTPVVEPKGTEDSNKKFDEKTDPEDSNKKVDEKTDNATVEDNNKVESDAVVGTMPPVEAEKDVENGDKHTEEKPGEQTSVEDKKETEKQQLVGQETESENAHEQKADKENSENDNKDADAVKAATSFSSFQGLSSSQNAFTGLAGTGFGTSSFSFGTVAKEGPAFGASSGPNFGFKSENASFPSFGGTSTNGSFSWQASATSASDATKSGVPSMQAVAVETGEENEKAVFTADAILYEYIDGTWKERGKGELKLNVALSGAEKSRLVMRARGNYRLILNASLYPDMALAYMDKKGITFACINSAGDGKDGLATFALKFRDSSFAEEFRGAVESHKGKKSVVLKTPENSPKASDD